MVGVCVISLAACKAQKASETVVVPAPTVKKVLDEPTKALPSDLYKNMPQYPDVVVEHVRKPKGSMREILFSSAAPLNQLVPFYKEQLKKNNFHITSSLIMPARKTWSCDFSINGQPGSIMLFPSDQDKSRMTIDLIYEMPAKVDETLLEPKEDFDVIGPGEIAQQAPKPIDKEAKRN
jgi:hypothetical protein